MTIIIALHPDVTTDRKWDRAEATERNREFDCTPQVRYTLSLPLPSSPPFSRFLAPHSPLLLRLPRRLSRIDHNYIYALNS